MNQIPMPSICDNCQWWNGVEKLHSLPHECCRHAPPWSFTNWDDRCGDFQLDIRKQWDLDLSPRNTPDEIEKANKMQDRLNEKYALRNAAIQAVEWPDV